MRLENKQVDNLSAFFNKVIVNARINNGVVTLERADGSSFSFLAVGQSYGKGEQGDKGDPGDKGDSAWQVYQKNGGTLSEPKWIDSLIGEQGDKGDPGTDGVNGIDGIDGLSPVITDGLISQDSSLNSPAVQLLKRDNNTYTVNFKVPVGQQGQQGERASDKTVRIGTVKTLDNGKSDLSVTNSVNDTWLNFDIIRGAKGFTGNDAPPAIDGTAPDIEVSVNMIAEDYVPTVTKEIKNNFWHLTFNIPKGKKGLQGVSGKQGKRATSVSDITYASICEDEGVINSPSFNSFRAVTFKIDDTRYYGWSLRSGESSDRIFQCAFSETGQCMIRTRHDHNSFGSVKEGWIPSDDIIGWAG